MTGAEFVRPFSVSTDTVSEKLRTYSNLRHENQKLLSSLIFQLGCRDYHVILKNSFSSKYVTFT